MRHIDGFGNDTKCKRRYKFQGKVDILIKFSEKDKVVEFSHNGKLFSTQNIVFLIEQVSTKDQEKEIVSRKKSTGKFGTGFLTTHFTIRKSTGSRICPRLK
ncbi:MAG: hypothetical protein PHX08_05870 [Lachnospiraceae bacterium]|nr:hypothetical protein [Lachnospiraceae bacterium]